MRHLNLRVRPFETEIIPRIGGGEGRIDDCANRVSREGLRDDVSERAGVVDDACGERQGIARVVGRELAPRRVRGVVGPEVAEIGGREMHVRIALPFPVKRTRALVPLHRILLWRGALMRVRVRRSAEHHVRVLLHRLDTLHDGCTCNGGFPAASGHGRCFGWGDEDDELSDAEGLDVNDVGGPGVGEVHLADVEEDGFGALACDLGRGGSGEEIGDGGPEGVLGLRGVIALDEIERAGAICCFSISEKSYRDVLGAEEQIETCGDVQVSSKRCNGSNNTIRSSQLL